MLAEIVKSMVDSRTVDRAVPALEGRPTRSWNPGGWYDQPFLVYLTMATELGDDCESIFKRSLSREQCRHSSKLQEL